MFHVFHKFRFLGCIAADEINGLPFDDFRYMLQIRAYVSA